MLRVFAVIFPLQYLYELDKHWGRLEVDIAVASCKFNR